MAESLLPGTTARDGQRGKRPAHVAGNGGLSQSQEVASSYFGSVSSQLHVAPPSATNSSQLPSTGAEMAARAAAVALPTSVMDRVAPGEQHTPTQHQHQHQQPASPQSPHQLDAAVSSPASEMQWQGDEPDFLCKTDTVTALISVLESLQFESPQLASCSVTRDSDRSLGGIKFVCGKAKTMQATAFLKSKFFQEFTVFAETVQFNVDISKVLRCLKIFGPDAHLEMSYSSDAGKLHLLLASPKNDAMTECHIYTTIDRVEELETKFRSSPCIGRISLQSELLRDTFAELTATTGQFLRLVLEDDPRRVRLIVASEQVTAEVHLSDTGVNPQNSIFWTFELQERVSQRYDLKMLSACIAAVAHGYATYIRVNATGVLSLQSILQLSIGKVSNWVDFHVMPLVEDEDEDGDLTL